MFKDKILLVTGGTGSFGNAVLRRFLNTEIGEIRIFSRDEKAGRYAAGIAHPKLKFYIGDVRNFNSINDAMRGVDYVFNAAALKQVPSCEFYPLEAVATNTAQKHFERRPGQWCEIRHHLEHRQGGLSHQCHGHVEGLDEKVAVAKARGLKPGQTIICVTRYGNVMASRGSSSLFSLAKLRAANQSPLPIPK